MPPLAAAIAPAAGVPAGVKPVHRLVNKADFERLLSKRSISRSAHFALHHLDGTPQRPQSPRALAAAPELSTSYAASCPQPVDDSPAGLWFGCVVPKRHARRAVTRSLLKRQLRGAFARHAAGLPGGLWLLRLRAPFAPSGFVSAASAALAAAARSELDGLLAMAGCAAR